jgi:hypothetical protein
VAASAATVERGSSEKEWLCLRGTTDQLEGKRLA